LPFFFRSVRRRNMMQRIYLHHAVFGNRVGLHYRRFWSKLRRSLRTGRKDAGVDVGGGMDIPLRRRDGGGGVAVVRSGYKFSSSA
jgi:hypothetical protein